MDLVFLLDASGSVRAHNFEKMKSFIGRMMERINVDGDELTNVGLATFADVGKVRLTRRLQYYSGRAAAYC